MKRRSVLLGTTALVPGFAGCSVLSSSSSMLSVTVFNHADSPYTVELTLFRMGSDGSRSDARVYDASIDVDSEGRASRENVTAARPYLVRYSVYEDDRKSTDEDHVHYYPSGDGDEMLAFDIDSTGTLTRR